MNVEGYIALDNTLKHSETMLAKNSACFTAERNANGRLIWAGTQADELIRASVRHDEIA